MSKLLRTTRNRRCCDTRHCCNKEVTQQYHYDVLQGKVPGPRRRSAFDRVSKVGGMSLRSEGAVNGTKPIVGSRPPCVITLSTNGDLSIALLFCQQFCVMC